MLAILGDSLLAILPGGWPCRCETEQRSQGTTPILAKAWQGSDPMARRAHSGPGARRSFDHGSSGAFARAAPLLAVAYENQTPHAQAESQVTARPRWPAPCFIR